MASVSAAAQDFDADLFETRLEALKDTQDGIQQMSAWCLKQRAQHKKIVASWLNVLKRVRVEHRLVLFYLANDVIQYSKRKRLEFVESWATALQKATTMVRDEKVKNKILRIFSIWEQREIYNEEFLTDLCGLLNITPPKKTHSTIPDQEDFQNASLVTSVRECVELSEITDRSFKKMPKTPNCDTESIKQNLKDKTHSDDVERELERYAAYIEAFNKNIQAEIKSRKNVLENLDTAIKFYTNQRGEVKVVVSAYKNFGSRIKLVKKKLDEITPTLSSPIPSPDINAPSPEPDADLQLPDDQSPISMSFFKNNLNGYTSYLDGNLPFDINDFKSEDSPSKIPSQPIEVIGSRSDDESFNSSTDYYKPESISAYPGNDNVMIPGLAPMPVPAVPSGGYTSLARSSQQYSDILPPPPNPPMFGSSNLMSNNLHHGINSGYTSHNPASYNTSDSYDPNPYTRANAANQNNGLRIGGVGPSAMQQPLMPPPPMPPSMGSVDGGDSSGGNNFNSPWDMGMSWNNPLDSSSASTSSYGNTPIDTPLSPPHYDTDPHIANSATLEYTEHDNSLSSAQDVDHRQLHLPAFGIGTKIGLSKEKSRQLDIDHRNLISLTGSPAATDRYQPSNESSGDIDYRVFGQNIKTIDSTTTVPLINDTSSISSADDIGNLSNCISPQKNDSPSKDSQKDEPYAQLTEEGSGTGGYDPTDMVVDMDMSDEDLDDIFREVNEQMAEQQSTAGNNGESNGETNGDEANESTTEVQHNQRPPLLETPAEYDPNTNWDCQEWSQMPPMPWQNNRGGGGGGGGPHVPPPPRPPYGMQYASYTPGVSSNEIINNPFATPSGSPVHSGRGGGFGPGPHGGGRGWDNSPQNQFRNFPRPPRGAGGMGGSPFFNRGGRGRGGGHLMMRGGGGGPGPGPGGFRGKFRGKNNWI